ncbi:hypothetical protein BIV25_45440 [Streptomyces sp. MUSC 14]|uniref:LGFP repeat-containing protein n=1 Tax=Streptomyces sp. MUSC 14 TaxID=1354889 RepID=UPI0008F5A34D|nr:DUF2599 domain-containing protein [Streptomyces sp. MUSC 14]OIJ84931.1 hypothetical protein BIV25_45440 [Streptomyces sp. MUSC 14]
MRRKRGLLHKSAGAVFAAGLLALTIQAPRAAADQNGNAAICGHQVQGAILAKYQAMGGQGSPLGCPTSDELTTPDGVGRYNTFVGGSIYWSPATDAHPVWGEILKKWAALGWERGELGYPVSDELTNPDGKGKRQQFQHATVYWSSASGAHPVSGQIGWVWSNYGWETGAFGYPTSDVYWDKDNLENEQHFADNRTIFESAKGNHIEGCDGPCAGYYGVASPGGQSPDLINETRIEIPLDHDRWKDQYVVRFWPTGQGRLVGKTPLLSKEWDQAWQEVPKPWAMNSTNEDSVYKQYVCHAVFSVPNPTKPGQFLGGPSWDFESWRADISWLKAMDPLTNHKCNW